MHYFYLSEAEIRLAPNGGQWELWLTDATAGGPSTLIGYGLFPGWSPVGSTILYQRAEQDLHLPRQPVELFEAPFVQRSRGGEVGERQAQFHRRTQSALCAPTSIASARPWATTEATS